MHHYRSYYHTKEEHARTEWLTRWCVNHGFMLTKVGIAALSTANTQAEIEQFARVVHAGLLELRHQGLAG